MIALTGGSGFLGTTLLRALGKDRVRILGRSKLNNYEGNFAQIELNSSADYTQALKGVDVVIHLAARAHIMNDIAEDPLAIYRETNTAGTLNLARQASKSGVKRFIFISSIKVNGESTHLGSPFKNDDLAAPEDPYGVSKMEAEYGLLQLAKSTGMEIVIIRPPLVYGLGVKANFASLMKLASKNLPLPLGAIKNKRSLVAIDNLVDLIITCIDHPNAVNQTFLVCDDHDVSTTELLSELTLASGKMPRLIPVPMKLIKVVAALLGRKAISDRLCGSLQIDITHTKDTLGWKPPVSFEHGISRCFEKV